MSSGFQRFFLLLPQTPTESFSLQCSFCRVLSNSLQVHPWRFMSQNSEWVRLRPGSVRYLAWASASYFTAEGFRGLGWRSMLKVYILYALCIYIYIHIRVYFSVSEFSSMERNLFIGHCTPFSRAAAQDTMWMLRWRVFCTLSTLGKRGVTSTRIWVLVTRALIGFSAGNCLEHFLERFGFSSNCKPLALAVLIS